MGSSGERRGLAGLLTAVGISGVGTRMSFLALPWFVLTTTGSAITTGLVAFAEMAPYVAAQAVGGPLVDRVGARRTSIVTDVAAALLIGAVPLLHLLGSLPLGGLFALVAVAGAARGLGDAARDVLVPGVGEIAGAAIERSSGLFDGVSRLSSLAGAPLAGVLVAATSALSVLAFDAVTFGVSALVVLRYVRRAADPAPAVAGAGAGAGEEAALSYLRSLREGFGYLLADGLLVGIGAMVFVTNFVDQAGSAVLFPVWADKVAHSPVALGLIGGALSLGAVIGNAVNTWLGPRLSRRLTYGVCFLVAGAPRLIALAVATTVSPVLIVMFIGGLGCGGINPILGAVEYERVPRHLQARVLGAVGALAWAGIPFGSLAGGLAVSAVGVRTALVGAAVIYGLTTLSPFLFPVWRQMERPKGPAANEPADGVIVGHEVATAELSQCAEPGGDLVAANADRS